MEKKEEYAKNSLVDSQSKWTLFSRDILYIAKELLSTLDALQVNQSIGKVPLPPIQEKLGRYEHFLQNNMVEIQRKHGIDMQKPTFIENLKGQMMGGARNQAGFDRMGGQAAFSQDGYQEGNSFEEEVAPIQRQLQNRFPPPQDLAPLDFAKIKEFLLNFDEEIKVSATLQALRWRLTKTKRKQNVRLVIYTYQHFDLLGCTHSSNQDASEPAIIN